MYLTLKITQIEYSVSARSTSQYNLKYGRNVILSLNSKTKYKVLFILVGFTGFCWQLWRICQYSVGYQENNYYNSATVYFYIINFMIIMIAAPARAPYLTIKFPLA